MLSNWCKICSQGCSDWDEFSRIAPWLSGDAARAALWTSAAVHWGQSCTARLGSGSVCWPGLDTFQQWVDQPMIHTREAWKIVSMLQGLTFSLRLTHGAGEGKIGLPLSLYEGLSPQNHCLQLIITYSCFSAGDSLSFYLPLSSHPLPSDSSLVESGYVDTLRSNSRRSDYWKQTVNSVWANPNFPTHLWVVAGAMETPPASWQQCWGRNAILNPHSRGLLFGITARNIK